MHRSNTESIQLLEAIELFEEGKFSEVLLSLRKIEKNKDLIDSDILILNLLKSSVFFRFREDKKCLKYAERAYQKSFDLGNELYSIDALLNMAWALLWLGDFENALGLILKSENLYRNLKNIDEIERERREASIFFIKSCACWFQAKMEGLDFAQKSLKLRQKVGKKYEIVESYSILCGFNTYFQEDLDKTLSLLEYCHELAIEINHPWMNSFNLKNFGDIYYMKGDLEKALAYYKKAVKPFEEKGNLLAIISTINEMGNIYREMGNLDQCLIYLKKVYKITMETKNNWVKSEVIANLIEVLIINGNIREAQDYLLELEEISKLEPNNNRIEQSYLISKALILKSSSRFQNQVKAQELFNLIINNDTVKNEFLIIALLNQCEILLEELRLTQNIEIIDEIQNLINKLLEGTNKLRSYWILAEIYVLQAELALLTFKLKKARQLLTRAQNVAEKYGLKRLAAKISIQHDNFLYNLSAWESLRDTNSSLTQRYALTNLNDQMTSLIQKRRTVAPIILEEDPIMILIITQGGNVIFTHTFISDKNFEFQLFGGFIATADYFIKEMFSEGLDRATFGKYTLLMEYIQPLYITYIFLGNSYQAHQRVKHFAVSLKDQVSIWENLMMNFESCKLLNLKDHPLLDSLIKQIFIAKSIKL